MINHAWYYWEEHEKERRLIAEYDETMRVHGAKKKARDEKDPDDFSGATRGDR